jgi:hypothetical protein
MLEEEEDPPPHAAKAGHGRRRGRKASDVWGITNDLATLLNDIVRADHDGPPTRPDLALWVENVAVADDELHRHHVLLGVEVWVTPRLQNHLLPDDVVAAHADAPGPTKVAHVEHVVVVRGHLLLIAHSDPLHGDAVVAEAELAGHDRGTHEGHQKFGLRPAPGRCTNETCKASALVLKSTGFSR